MSPRRRADETCGTTTMFDVEPLKAMRDETTRAKAPKPDAYGQCPGCDRHHANTNTKIQTALIRTGEHLVWKNHDITTWSGTKRPCRASGVPVCQAPCAVEPKVECPCGATGPDAA